MEPMKYDEGWIVAFAMALEKKAQSLVARARINALLVGAALASALIAKGDLNIYMVVLPPVFITTLFWSVLQGRAESQAAMIRLKAHQALCQVQIERNTRK